MVALQPLLWAFIVFFLATTTHAVSSPRPPLVLRFRMPDGSIQKVGLDTSNGKGNDDILLKDVLQGISQDTEGLTVHLSGSSPSSKEAEIDPQQSLQALGLRHGSLLVLQRPSSSSSSSCPAKGLQKKKPAAVVAATTTSTNRWNPYPDLAKNYHQAKRQYRRKTKTAASYSDLAKIQSEMHVVEAQPEGPVQRLYMCQVAAEHFATQAVASSSSSLSQPQPPRAALLLGTIQKERKDAALKRKPKTSLSSTTEAEEYCTAAKVQALWQPSPPPPVVLTQTDTKDSSNPDDNMQYDAASLLLDSSSQGESQKYMLQVAEWLGLQPIGWIFTYNNNNNNNSNNSEETKKTNKKTKNRHDDDGLPVYAPDVHAAAQLQILNMQQWGREKGDKFVTLAMDGSTGATEAFQLSQVAVQMTAEGVLGEGFLMAKSSSASSSTQTGRFLETTIPVVVDGKETHKVDSVLCLVNTALLSHTGMYAGSSDTTNVLKKTGGFTKKIKKRLSAALLANDDAALLQHLCNFTLLVALTERLESKALAETLVTAVRKFAQGRQKLTTKLDSELKQKIGLIVDSY